MAKVQDKIPELISFKLQSGARKRYNVLHKLGKGGFASVHLVRSADSGRQYACKFVLKSSLHGKKEAQRKMKSEIEIHRMCSGHCGVVGFVNCFDDRNYIYIMMEYVDGGTLMSLIRREGKISELECKGYMKQLIQVISYLHEEHHIIHRDLKLANILLTRNNKIKICDFGLAAIITSCNDRKTTICGTPNYIAPEIVLAMGSGNGNGNGGSNGNDDKKGHSYEVDVWSLGVMMYIMICGIPPFQGPTLKCTINRIKESRYAFPCPSKTMVSAQAKNLIDGMLTLDVKQRLTVFEIPRHPWFHIEQENKQANQRMDISDMSFLNHNVPELLYAQLGRQ